MNASGWRGIDAFVVTASRAWFFCFAFALDETTLR